MTLGSLFAGIGGFELAATWAGITPVWSNEIDPFACKVLRKNFDHKIYECDIRELPFYPVDGIYTNSESNRRNSEALKEMDAETDKRKQGCRLNNMGKNTEEYEKSNEHKVDIITGGFPCQPFSHAGKRKGTADDRFLWFEMLDIIQAVRPRYVIGENVAGLLSMENGKTLDTILTSLENAGYQAEVYIIPACGVGAWHKRDRVWIVGYSNNTRNRNGTTTNKNGSKEGKKRQRLKESEPCKTSEICTKNVPNATSQRQPEPGRSFLSVSSKEDEIGKANISVSNGEWWDVEPNVGRVANGVSNRMDRLKGLGNAIVPQVAYQIFKAILEHDH